MPTEEQIEQARIKIEEEDRQRDLRQRSPERLAIEAENHRRTLLPSEHPEHLHSMYCDGQDGIYSYCARLRWKLFGGGAP